MPSFKSAIAIPLLLPLLVATRLALAEGAAAPTAVDSPPPQRLVATTELVGALLGRYGLQLEYVAGKRDTITAYGWHLSAESQGTASLLERDPDYQYDTQTRAGGLETQYRRYFGFGSGASGGFVAAGLELQSFVTDTARSCAGSYEYNNPGSNGCPSQPPAHHEAFSYLGASVDVGAQTLLPLGFTFAASFGFHYRDVVGGSLDPIDRPFGWSISHGPGLRPRSRFSLGWAF